MTDSPSYKPTQWEIDNKGKLKNDFNDAVSKPEKSQDDPPPSGQGHGSDMVKKDSPSPRPDPPAIGKSVDAEISNQEWNKEKTMADKRLNDLKAKNEAAKKQQQQPEQQQSKDSNPAPEARQPEATKDESPDQQAKLKEAIARNEAAKDGISGRNSLTYQFNQAATRGR
jgi:hypothetical protein